LVDSGELGFGVFVESFDFVELGFKGLELCFEHEVFVFEFFDLVFVESFGVFEVLILPGCGLGFEGLFFKTGCELFDFE